MSNFQQSPNRQFTQSPNKQRDTRPALILYDSQSLVFGGFDVGTLQAKLNAASFQPLADLIAADLATFNPPLNPPGQPRTVLELGWYEDTFDFPLGGVGLQQEHSSLHSGNQDQNPGGINNREGASAFVRNPGFFDGTIDLGANPFVLAQITQLGSQVSFFFQDIEDKPGTNVSYIRWVGRRSRIRFNFPPARLWTGLCGIHYVNGPIPTNPAADHTYALTDARYISEVTVPVDQWYEIPYVTGGARFVVANESPLAWSTRTGIPLANLPAF